MNARILIIDDERLLRWSLRRKCQDWEYEVVEAESIEQGKTVWSEEQPDLVLLDVRLPDGSGVDLLRAMRQEHAAAQVVMITADPKVEDVKTALRLGAYDYLTKPIDFDELQLTISNALEVNKLRKQVNALQDEVRRVNGGMQVVGRSPQMRSIMDFVAKVAASEATAILIQGESGTGKDLIAQSLHAMSSRSEQAYVAVNCSAIPENLLEAELFGHEKGAFTDARTQKKGLFEMANGGTLFLDEIGELPLMLQSKLLRVLEDQSFRRLGGVKDLKVDVRIVAASNRNLEEAARSGQFRQDLFYRLMVIPIFIPPLRNRRDDILALANFFIEHYNVRFRKKIEGLTHEAEQLMLNYDWPGNVRELKNAIQRAMILEDSSRIRPTYLPFYHESGPLLTSNVAFPDQQQNSAITADSKTLPNGRQVPLWRIPSAGTSMEEVERVMVTQALSQTHGNQSQAARLLDISRDALRYKMKKFGLENGEAAQ